MKKAVEESGAAQIPPTKSVSVLSSRVDELNHLSIQAPINILDNEDQSNESEIKNTAKNSLKLT